MIIKLPPARQSAMAGAGSGLPPRRRSDANLGRSMGGLVRYLLGPGKSNEHIDQRVVAGSEPLEFEYGDVDFARDVFAPAEAANMIAELNRPMEAKRTVGELPPDRGFVFHAVFSMEPGRSLSDDKWRDIAHDYVKEMGFDDAEGTKAPCRWVAIHHGPSANGNDHIHLALQMIRDDGTWASNANSMRRTAAARRTLEVKHGLGRVQDLAKRPGHVPYPIHDAHRAGAQAGPAVGRPAHGDQPAHERLRERMLAAAAAAQDEADYVRRLWRSRIITRPRYADGDKSVVTGYSVALVEADGSRSTWRGGGTVHPSLRLPRLRQRWESTPENAALAARMWRAEKGAAAQLGDSVRVNRPAAKAVENLKAANVAWTTLGDAADTTQIHKMVSGTYAALAHRHERGRGGPLHEAAEAFARTDDRSQARLPARLDQPAQRSVSIPLGRAVRLIAQSGSDNDLVSWMALFEQLRHLSQAVADRDRALSDLNETRHLTEAIAAAGAAQPARADRLMQQPRPATMPLRQGESAAERDGHPEAGPER